MYYFAIDEDKENHKFVANLNTILEDLGNMRLNLEDLRTRIFSAEIDNIIGEIKSLVGIKLAIARDGALGPKGKDLMADDSVLPGKVKEMVRDLMDTWRKICVDLKQQAIRKKELEQASQNQ